MYVAKHYIGREYVPGEVITEDLSPDVIKRLLAAGAIEPVRETVDVTYRAPDPDTGTGDATDEDGAGEDTTEIDEDTTEIDEEAEPEEIDAADGIITAPAPKTESKRGGRSGGGKGK